MSDITIPKLNNNDSTYLLLEWLADDGANVEADEPVASIETSKAVDELVAGQAGALRQALPAGTRLSPGTVIGRILPPGVPDPGPRHGEPESALRPATPGDDVPLPAEAEPIVTEPARVLMEQLKVTPEQVRGLGKKLVREADVRKLATTGQGTRLHARSPVQAAVARTVTTSHSTIPTAFTAMRVTVDAVLAEARTLTRRMRCLVGLPEFVITAIAALHRDFPLFFASDVGEGTLAEAAGACVGVTVDVGKGLYIPVVKDADGLTIAQIIEAVTAYRDTALHGQFSEGDLQGGNITVTLHTDPDVVVAQPLVFPGQTCALSLPGIRRELHLDASGEVGHRSVVDVGISYDHRRVNGREVIQFLGALKGLLESPRDLLGAEGASEGGAQGGGG
uniref:2-oxo acid dehydrogenase subunit E2 n=1 Tax=Microbispora cellulosiformans TaxID=2614688 RepID=UPI00177D8311|nr:2-oxo acid dehydrogenase subunit E2 [Microbispora cellulosiformans]